MTPGQSICRAVEALDDTTARALLGAWLVSLGVPAPVAAAVSVVGAEGLRQLGELLCKHEAGLPLPAVERAELPDGEGVVAGLLRRELEGAPPSRDTWPAPPESDGDPQ